MHIAWSCLSKMLKCVSNRRRFSGQPAQRHRCRFPGRGSGEQLESNWDSRDENSSTKVGRYMAPTSCFH